MYGFIGVVQGVPIERTQTTHHIFSSINDLFLPNNSRDWAREDPIFIQNVEKGDAEWSTKTNLLGWVIDMINLVLTLPQVMKVNLTTSLESVS